MLKRFLDRIKSLFGQKIGYWVFIILLTIGALLLLKPLLNTLGSIYAHLVCVIENIKRPSTLDQIKRITTRFSIKFKINMPKTKRL